MFVTTHVGVGALTGGVVVRAGSAGGVVAGGPRVRAGGVATGLITGLASHVALDAVPHWGVVDRFTPGRDRRRFLRAAAVDGVTAATLAYHLVVGAPRATRPAVAAAIAGAVLLDLNKPVYELTGRSPFPRRVDAWHRAIQRERDSPARFAAEVVAALAVAALSHALVVRPEA